MATIKKLMKRLPTFSTEMGFAVLAVCGVTALIVPLPLTLIDFLLATQMMFSFCMLVAVLLVKQPSQLSLFPSVVVLATLARLTLNISTTRAILGQGNAGRIVQAFGEYVSAGSPLVGAILFLLITLVQYIVISRGSERIAQVAARFSLDAMPGRLSAIDGEQRMGQIAPSEARRQRANLAEESTLFSNLDGAMKFVRGDALVGLFIVSLNAIGGFVLGMGQQKLSFDEALNLYTILTVGDGLGSQIPSLLQGISAAVLATRIASEDQAFTARILHQLVQTGRPLKVVFVLCALFAIFSPLPAWPFMVLALVCALVLRCFEFQKPPEPQSEPQPEPEVMSPMLICSPTLRDELEKEAFGPLALQLRNKLFNEYGFFLQDFQVVTDRPCTSDSEYQLLLTHHVRETGMLKIGCRFTFEPSDDPQNEQRDPFLGISGHWSSTSHGRNLFEMVYVHLLSLMQRHSAYTVGLQRMMERIRLLSEDQPVLSHSAVNWPGGLDALARHLRALVRDGFSLRDFALTLEHVGAVYQEAQDFEAQYRLLRKKMAYFFSSLFASASHIEVIQFSTEAYAYLQSLEFAYIPEELIVQIEAAWQRHPSALLLVQDEARPALAEIFRSLFPGILVVSDSELLEQKPYRLVDLILLPSPQSLPNPEFEELYVKNFAGTPLDRRSEPVPEASTPDPLLSASAL